MINKKNALKTLKTLKPVTNDKPALNNIAIMENSLHYFSGESQLIIEDIEKIDLHNIYSEDNFFIDKEVFTKFYGKKDNCKIQKNEKNALLFSDITKLKISNYDLYDFRNLYSGLNLKSDFIDINDSAELNKKIVECSKFANQDKNRYSLNCVKLDFQNKMIVSTNQIVLKINYYSDFFTTEDIFLTNDFNISLSDIKTLKTLDYDKIQLSEDAKYVIFSGENFKFIVQNIETQFPQYKNAFENFKNNPTINFQNSELKQMINDLKMVSCEYNKIALFNGENFKLSSPIGEIIINLDYKGIDLSIFNKDGITGINIFYIEEYLKLKNENFSIYFSGSKKPLIIEDINGLFFMSPSSI